MKEFLANTDELAAVFGVDPSTGLDDEKVKENAAKYGLNSLAGTKPVSLLKRIIDSASEPIRRRQDPSFQGAFRRQVFYRLLKAGECRPPQRLSGLA